MATIKKTSTNKNSAQNILKQVSAEINKANSELKKLYSRLDKEYESSVNDIVEKVHSKFKVEEWLNKDLKKEKNNIINQIKKVEVFILSEAEVKLKDFSQKKAEINKEITKIKKTYSAFSSSLVSNDDSFYSKLNKNRFAEQIKARVSESLGSYDPYGDEDGFGDEKLISNVASKIRKKIKGCDKKTISFEDRMATFFNVLSNPYHLINDSDDVGLTSSEEKSLGSFVSKLFKDVVVIGSFNKSLEKVEKLLDENKPFSFSNEVLSQPKKELSYNSVAKHLNYPLKDVKTSPKYSKMADTVFSGAVKIAEEALSSLEEQEVSLFLMYLGDALDHACLAKAIKNMDNGKIYEFSSMDTSSRECIDNDVWEYIRSDDFFELIEKEAKEEKARKKKLAVVKP